MAVVAPDQLITGCEVLAANGPAPVQGIFIPLTSLPDLSAAEAAADGRKVAFGLVKEIYERYAALADAAKPGKMTVLRGTPTGVNATTVRQSFTMNFDLNIRAADVTDEA